MKSVSHAVNPEDVDKNLTGCSKHSKLCKMKWKPSLRYVGSSLRTGKAKIIINLNTKYNILCIVSMCPLGHMGHTKRWLEDRVSERKSKVIVTPN